MSVAIVGLGCRLPGATGPDAFFELLRTRRRAVAPLPQERWDDAAHAGELPAGARFVPEGCLVDDLPLDWRALRLPPLDAERMHRLERAALAALMQAIADAALPKTDAHRARTRIFIAATTFGPDPRTDHSRRIRRDELQTPVNGALRSEIPERHQELEEILQGLYNLAAPPIFPESLQATASLLAGRIATIFDYSGGHIAVDGGMASGLAALDIACRALEDGQCDAALLCGVSPLLSPSVIASFAHKGFLARGPHAPFSPRSTGAILGEGAVALALVRSDDAADAYARISAVETATAASDAAEDVAQAASRAAQRCAERAARARVKVIETRAAGVKDHDAAVTDAVARVHARGGRDRPVLTSSVSNVGLVPSVGGLVGVLRAAIAFRTGYMPGHTDVTRDDAEDTDVDDGRGVAWKARVDVALGDDAAIAVSDAGLAPHVGHALITSARAPSAGSRSGSGSGSGSGTGARSRVPVSNDGRERHAAIVGLGAVAPGANDVRAFWRTILERHDRIGDLPKSRFDVERFVRASEDVGTILRTRLAATVDVPADVLAGDDDPATWLACKAAHEAMADAFGVDDSGAFSMARLAHGDDSIERIDPARVGVYLGQLSFRFAEAALEKRVLFASHMKMTEEALLEADVDPAVAARIRRRACAAFDAETRRMSAASFHATSGFPIAHAVARAIGAAGPIVSLDAACASALAAVNEGLAALRRGDVDVAVCGGVAFHLLPEYYMALSVLSVLSPHAAPPFSLQSDGFVPGEGAGVVVLVRRDDAERMTAGRASQRRVRAVLRGAGMSSDGRGLSVYTPRAEGQIASLVRGLEDAQVSANDIDFIEAHGTGTRAGDDCEIKSYATVYGERDVLRPISIGAVKSQIGHLSSAAGALGLIKAVLALEERVVPPSLFDEQRHTPVLGALELGTVARPWLTPAHRVRRAGVSAFGLGGVNLHVVLEEARDAPAAPLGPLLGHGRGPFADRFEVALAPVSLPAREPTFSLQGKRALIVPPDPDVAGARDDADANDPWDVVDNKRVRNVDAHALAYALHLELAKRGAIVVDAASASARELAPDVVLDLSAAGRSPHMLTAPNELVTWCETKLGAALDRVRTIDPDAPPRSSAYVAVTQMGDLGLLGSAPDRCGAAVLLGLMKSVKLELPPVLAKGIDLDPALPAQKAAALVLDELEDGNDRLECVYTATGKRLVVQLRHASAGIDESPLRSFQAGDVFVFSGGGRGIVFECALAFALAGGRAVVTGRTALPDPLDEPTLDGVTVLDDAAFAEYKRSELLRRRADDRTLTPARFAEQFANVERARELKKNLERARRAGVDLVYQTCDVTDARDVARLIADVRKSHGRIDGVVHGAMVEHSTSLQKKTEAMVRATLRTKLAGFVNLLRATADAPPHTFVSFGSGAGRFGNLGQSDYCAANNVLAAATAAARVVGRTTRFVTIDWTAWADAGAAVRSNEMVKNLGLTMIRAHEGVRWFLHELVSGRGGECIVCEERTLHGLRFLGERAEGPDERAVRFDDAGAVLVPAAWPLVDRLVERPLESAPESAWILERTLDVERDAFVRQHRLYGVPILPAAFGVELVAETAAIAWPGFSVVEVRDLAVGVPAKLHRGEPLALRLHGRVVDRKADELLVDVETHSELLRNGNVLQDRVHHTARVLLRRASSTANAAPAVRPIPELPGIERARSFFHLSEEPIGLGPLYSRGGWVRLVDDELTASVLPPQQREASRGMTAPLFAVDPLMLDASWQLAANWDGILHGHSSVPMSVASVRVGRARAPNEHGRVHAKVVDVEGKHVRYDVVLVGDRDEVLLETRGLVLLRIGKTP